MLFSCLLMMLLIISGSGQDCDDITCANIFDDVCGQADFKDGTQTITPYQNICFMRKDACQLESFAEITQVSDELCDIEKPKLENRHDDYQIDGRRVQDFSIVGAHQACNHSCPIYCPDTYEPACAQVWKPNLVSYTFRPMLNHCHIDLYSCTTGVNVTVQPISKCYKNAAVLMFMVQVAAMKSLKLLPDETAADYKSQLMASRRTNDNTKVAQTGADDIDANFILKEQLEEVVRRIFEKYREDNFE